MGKYYSTGVVPMFAIFCILYSVFCILWFIWEIKIFHVYIRYNLSTPNIHNVRFASTLECHSFLFYYPIVSHCIILCYTIQCYTSIASTYQATQVWVRLHTGNKQFTSHSKEERIKYYGSRENGSCLVWSPHSKQEPFYSAPVIFGVTFSRTKRVIKRRDGDEY